MKGVITSIGAAFEGFNDFFEIVTDVIRDLSRSEYAFRKYKSQRLLLIVVGEDERNEKKEEKKKKNEKMKNKCIRNGKLTCGVKTPKTFLKVR